MEDFDCKDFVIYKLKNGNVTKTLLGIEKRKGYLNHFISYNKFKERAKKIPAGYKKSHIKNETRQRLYCGTRIKLSKDNKFYNEIRKKTKDFKAYLIMDNGGRPFLVYLKNDKCYIYKKDENNYYHEEDEWEEHWTYIDLVKELNYQEEFVGYNHDFMCGEINDWPGNSILLRLTKEKYLFIGWKIFEFKPKDKIIKYESPMGNNWVPYPFAIGEKNIYFMIEQKYVPIKEFNFPYMDKVTLYEYYYGFEGNKKLENYSKDLKDVKIVHERIWE